MLPSDPDMLASFLNMKLREADYDYVPARNQFL